MAVFARGFLAVTFVVFALFFAAARFLIVMLWVRAGFFNPSARTVTARYATGYGIAIALWIAAIFSPLALRVALVATALIVDFVTPAFTMRGQALLPRLSASHLPERFGTFIIIVLGESVVSVVAVLARQPALSARDATATLFVILFAFSLWWLYFDHIAENPPLKEPWRAYGFGLLHLPLVCALTAVGAAGQSFIAGPALGSPAITALTGVAASITFFTVGALEFTTEPTAERRHPARSLSVHWGAAAGALAVGLAAGGISTLPALVVLLGLAVAQVVYGIYTRAVEEAAG
jgi:low temperature requirement protein LtrA